MVLAIELFFFYLFLITLVNINFRVDKVNLFLGSFVALIMEIIFFLVSSSFFDLRYASNGNKFCKIAFFLKACQAFQ